MQIAHHTFVITGGASGLGAATADYLVAQQANVVLLDLNLEKLAAQVAKLGRQALSFQVDICNEQQVQEALDATVAHFGAIDGVINCAGIATVGRILGKEAPHSLELFMKTLQINVGGSFNLLRLASAMMSKNTPNEQGERGIVINTASVAAFDGQLGQAAYASSKGAIASLTLPAARELAKFGIRVMTIAPGIFETPMMAGLSPEVQASLAADVPFPPRLGKPAEYAQLAAHIISNPMLNGETIRLDGALRMGIK